MRSFLALLVLGAACSGSAPPITPPPVDTVDIQLVPEADHDGNVVVLLPDRRGLIQAHDRSIRVVDPHSGVELERHDAALPADSDCALLRWGQRPALICDSHGIYRLDDGGAWAPVTRAVTEGSQAVVLSDDGVHAGYALLRCPGDPPPPPPGPGVEQAWVACLFGPGGWKRLPRPGYEAAIAMRGARLAMLVGDRDAGTSGVDWIDAETLATTHEPLPTFRGNDALWRSPPLYQPWDQPAGSIYLLGSSGIDGVADAGLLTVRSPDGTYSTVFATDAPRERWGVRVAFADDRHAIAAGSFYRHIYYTVDAGAHWTAIEGLDVERDARVPSGRLMEDSAMAVHCDVTRACRVRLNGPEDLVVRFR